MNARRLALSAVVAGSLFVPLAAAPPAQAVHCPPGSYMITGDSFFYPVIGPARLHVSFYATSPLGVPCAQGVVTGNCPNLVAGDGSNVTVQADAFAGESCLSGADRFFVLAWAP